MKLKADEYIQDVIFAMKEERPGRRGAEAFPKWSLLGLLKYLNSDAFEPLERANWRIIRNKLLVLIFLNTGRRNGEIGAISDFYWRGDEVIFKWFPDFLAKMEKDFGEWKSDPPKISPFIQGDNVYVPSEPSTT